LIFELAGIAGVEPWSFSLRQLVWMAEKRRWADWDTTSSLIAKLHNVHCAKRSDMITPDQIHPFAPKPTRIELSPKESGDLLVALLVPK
jgi:hypothetical protein